MYICYLCYIAAGDDPSQPSVCSGILNRTFHSQETCQDMLGILQRHMLEGISPAPPTPPPRVIVPETPQQFTGALHPDHEALLESTRDTVKLTISTTIAAAALVQVLSGVFLCRYSSRENGLRLNAAHWQAIFGLVTLLLSYVYHSYCCILFYSHLATWLAIFCLIQVRLIALHIDQHSPEFLFKAVTPWHFQSKTTARQLFSVIGAALSTALLAVLSFGIYC